MNTFEYMVDTYMTKRGFERLAHEQPANIDETVLKFAKDGTETFVSASGREIVMNSAKEPMINLVQARTRNAILTWKNNKQHGSV